MNRGSVLKISGAFLAGVVVTLGSLVYSHTRELIKLRKEASNAASVQFSTRIRGSREVGGTKESSNNPETVNAGVLTKSAEKSGVLPELMRHAGLPEVPEPEVEQPDQPTPVTSHPDSVKRARLPRTPNGSTPEFLTLAAPVPAQDLIGVAGSPNSTATDGAKTEAEPQTKLVTLQPGTRLTINLGAALSSDRNSVGDTFGGTLNSRLVVNGITLAERGSPVFGEIIKVKRAHLFRGVSDLGLVLTQITTKDGQPIKLDTSLWEEKRARNSIEETPRLAAGAAIGAVRGAFSGMAKGAGFSSSYNANTGIDPNSAANKRIIALAAGTPIAFYLARPVTVSARVN